jgi:hypothetical protein
MQRGHQTGVELGRQRSEHRIGRRYQVVKGYVP